MPRTRKAPKFKTVDELIERFGVPPSRILMDPFPGTATEADVLRYLELADKKICELIDGTLVEKDMSAEASYVAGILIGYLQGYLRANCNPGMVLGPDGTLKIMPGMVRIPDVSYTSWDRLPGRKVPVAPIPELYPDLAVEVLSPGNTKAEMAQKRKDYFVSGVSVVWQIDPIERTVRVYNTPDDSATYAVGDIVDAAPVLPDFRVPVADLFANLQTPPPKKRGKANGSR